MVTVSLPLRAPGTRHGGPEESGDQDADHSDQESGISRDPVRLGRRGGDESAEDHGLGPVPERRLPGGTFAKAS